jgi:hypothetical protein
MSESNESRPARSRVVLRNISSRTWEHPADRGALVALRKLKGFDTVVKLMSGLVNERSVRLLFLGSAIRVDERQFPTLHRALNEAAGILDDLDQTSFFEQGVEYDAALDLRDSVLKLLLHERRSHPMTVSRAGELRRWVDSGAYTAILAGEYPTRDSDDEAKVSEAAEQAARSYTEAVRDTQDTLGRLVHDTAGWMGSAKVWLDEQWRRRGDEDAS